MKKITSSVLLISMLASSAYARTSVGVNQYFTLDGVKYEVLDFEAKTLGISSLTQDAANYLFCPSIVNVSGEFIKDSSRLTLDNEPFTVTQINDDAFAGNKSFYYICFPETLTDIGDRAFKGCSLLTFDSFPDALRSIGDETFNGCASVTRITLPENVSELGEGAFSEMSGLTRVVMQNCNVTEIKNRTFYNDKEITELYLPLCVKSIGDEAFFNTLSLDELYFPEGLERIGSRAFCGQSYDYGGYAGGLDRLTLPSTILEIGMEAFRVTPMYSADLSKCTALREIPEGAFQNTYNLSSIKLPKGLEKIGANAFNSCGSNASIGMIDVEIPSSVTEIGTGAFRTKLTSVKVGNNVTNLPAYSLGTPSSVEIGSGVKSINSSFDFSDLRLFRLHAPTPPELPSPPSLTAQQYQNITVIVDDGTRNLYDHHPVWSLFNIVEENASTVSVHLYGNTRLADEIYLAGVMPSRVTDLTVTGELSTEDITTIRENMFSLTSLDISGTTLTEIPSGAFMGMTLLSSIKLPEGLKNIGANAFNGCRSMHLTELPETVEVIGTEAFLGCSSITVSRLPEALVSLGYRSFSECISLKSIVAGPNLTGRLSVPFSSCRMLEYADFSASKITEFGANALYACSSLRTVLLPETVTAIGYRAFAISGLRSVSIPGSVRSLGKEVFYKTPLRALALEEGIESLPEGTFSDCIYLLTASFPSTLKTMGNNTFSKAQRVSMISCAAKTAPQASSSSFTGILTQKASLTIPRKSLSSYLNAPGWGMFANIDFILEVEVPEDVDVTVIPEDDYQDLVEEETLLAEQDENAAEIPGEEPAMRARRLAANRQASQSLLDGSQFARIYNGASIRSAGEGNGNRFFIRGVQGVDYEQILFNDTDITDMVEDGMLILPSDAQGTLRFVSSNAPLSIETVEAKAIDGDTSCEVYSITGMKVYEGAFSGLSECAPGIYIVRAASGEVLKIALN